MEFKYLNLEKMNSLSADEFQNQEPYPWLNPNGVLFEEAYRTLVANQLSLNDLNPSIGNERPFGQQSHDRYSLEYEESLHVPQVWHDFVKELKSDEFTNFKKRMFREEECDIRFHWHYAVPGQSVSPHTDGTRKIGSFIFYMNTNDDWKEEWGGNTLVLHDKAKKLDWQSAPDYADFDEETPSRMLENYCFMFKRNNHSWHAVRELQGEEGMVRKIFIAVIDKPKENPGLLGKIKNKVKTAIH